MREDTWAKPHSVHWTRGNGSEMSLAPLVIHSDDYLQRQQGSESLFRLAGQRHEMRVEYRGRPAQRVAQRRQRNAKRQRRRLTRDRTCANK